MAEQADIVDDWFVGEDKIFAFTIYQKDSAGNLTTTPQNISGWTLRWDLRRSDSAADPVVLTKTPTVTNGALGQGQFTIDDTDTDNLAAKVYRHALKRTDGGSETVLFYGNAVLGKRTTR